MRAGEDAVAEVNREVLREVHQQTAARRPEAIMRAGQQHQGAHSDKHHVGLMLDEERAVPLRHHQRPMALGRSRTDSLAFSIQQWQ